MKADRNVKVITFTPSEVNPGETLYVHVPKLNRNEVIMPGSGTAFQHASDRWQQKQLSRQERLKSTG